MTITMIQSGKRVTVRPASPVRKLEAYLTYMYNRTLKAPGMDRDRMLVELASTGDGRYLATFGRYIRESTYGDAKSVLDCDALVEVEVRDA